jgi:hypothetical protein
MKVGPLGSFKSRESDLKYCENGFSLTRTSRNTKNIFNTKARKKENTKKQIITYFGLA